MLHLLPLYLNHAWGPGAYFDQKVIAISSGRYPNDTGGCAMGLWCELCVKGEFGYPFLKNCIHFHEKMRGWGNGQICQTHWSLPWYMVVAAGHAHEATDCKLAAAADIIHRPAGASPQQ